MPRSRGGTAPPARTRLRAAVLSDYIREEMRLTLGSSVQAQHNPELDPRAAEANALTQGFALPSPIYPPQLELQARTTRLGERTREWGAFMQRGFRPEWRCGTKHSPLIRD